MMATSIWTLVNLILLLGGIFGLVLFIVVFLKLNKALKIWLDQNQEK